MTRLRNTQTKVPCTLSTMYPYAAQTLDMFQGQYGTSYLMNILGEIPASILPLRESYTARQRHVALRHDVDFSLFNAFAMAKVEQRFGIRSTYFLLPPSGIECTENYFGRLQGNRLEISPNILKFAQVLQDMGHEVGLHNDLITLALMTKRSPASYLDQILETFRKAGVHIDGTAAHGSPLALKLGYINYNIFQRPGHTLQDNSPEEIIGQDGYKISLHCLNMHDFSLLYEAYWIPHQAYYSDSRGINTFSIKSAEVDIPHHNKNIFVDAFLQHDIHCLQMLIHADHWSALLNDCTSCLQRELDTQESIYINKCMEIRKTILKISTAVLQTAPEMLDALSSTNALYAKNRAHFVQENFVKNFTIQMLHRHPQTSVLEVGCGQGDFLDSCVAALGPEITVLGVDGAFAAIADCATKYPWHHWIVGDLRTVIDDLLQKKFAEQGIPATFSCIIDKTGLTHVPDFPTAYALLKKLTLCMEDGAHYLYIASSEFYARRYADIDQWPYGWLEILEKVFGPAEVCDVPGMYLRCYSKKNAPINQD